MEPVVDSGSDVLEAKLTAMAVLGISSLALGLLPIKLSHWLGWDRPQYKNQSAHPTKPSAGCTGGDILSCLLCGGAGVLLCTTLVHLLPEVRNSAEKFVSDLPAPLNEASAELLMCAGFFLMYLAEELVHLVLHRRHQHGAKHTGSNQETSATGTTTPALGDPKESAIQNIQWSFHEDSRSKVDLSYADGTKTSTEASSQCHRVHHEHPDAEEIRALPEFMSAANHHSHVVPMATGSASSSASSAAPEEPLAAIRGLLIVMALSVHELFEGLAVGLEEKAAHVWYMMGAVACHKLVIAFCIGVELVSMQTRTILVVLYVGTFAIVSPIGIAVGVGVSIGENAEDALAALILQGLSSGTLLYVIFFEILERQRSCGSRGLLQLVSVFVGFLIMLGLAFFGHGHEHEHHH